MDKKVIILVFALIIFILFLLFGNNPITKLVSDNKNLNTHVIHNELSSNRHPNHVEEKLIGNIDSIKILEYKGKVVNGKFEKRSFYGKYLSKYDKKGRIEEHSSYLRYSKYPFRTSIYKYSDENLSERIEIVLDEDGNRKNQYVYEKYTYENNKIKIYRYSEEGKMIYYYEILFNSSDNELTVRTDNKFTKRVDGQVYKYYYNEDGNIKRKTEKWDGGASEVNYEVKYDIDDLGNIIETTRTNLEDTSIKSGNKIQYDYDQRGNWIRKVSQRKKDGRIFISERSIYYN